MTAPALDNTTAVRPPRPGSRIARLAQPLARNVLRLVAEANNVCVNPIVLRRTDLDTGETGFIEVPCGARLAGTEGGSRGSGAPGRSAGEIDSGLAAARAACTHSAGTRDDA